MQILPGAATSYSPVTLRRSTQGQGGAAQAGGTEVAAAQAEAAPPGTPAAERNLSQEARDQIQELQKTDMQVRQHEQAHKTAGGPYAGNIRLEYTTGPDGRRYATAGEVPIDVSPVRGDPEATITKMEVVKRAALAPAEPSPQDRAVASQADATKAQAQSELRSNNNTEDESRQAGREGRQGEAVSLSAQAKQAQAAYGGSSAPAATIFSLIA